MQETTGHGLWNLRRFGGGNTLKFSIPDACVSRPALDGDGDAAMTSSELSRPSDFEWPVNYAALSSLEHANDRE